MGSLISNQQRKTLFVDVILPLFIPKTYTYRIPFEWNSRIHKGIRVIVQFGRTKIYSAIVKEISDQAPSQYEAKYILDIVDEEAIVTDLQIELWEWIAGYYMCNLGDVMQAALPATLKLASETKITASHAEGMDRSNLSDKAFLIMDALDVAGELKVNDIVKLLGQKTVFPLLKSLFSQGYILISEEVKEKFKPKVKTFLVLNADFRENDRLRMLLDSLNNAPKQQDALLAFIQLSRKQQNVTRQELMEASGAGAGSVKSLVDKGILDLQEQTVSRLEGEGIELLSSFELSSAQKQALLEIDRYFKQKEVVLLHGITASGKTQIYIRLIERMLKLDHMVLYLLPEIALTSQITERLKLYFGDQLVVYHSKFNDNERAEIWEKVLQNKCKVVLGARSAVFLPFQNLGFVIIDEEHENSYKQFDPAPRYHARDTAIYLAGLFKAKVLLGSATPALESYYNAKSGKYGLVKLDQRYGQALLPDVKIVDVNEEGRAGRMHSYFSSHLLESIQEALGRKEQVILFQNRRGHTTFLQCKTCGHVAKCINCDVSLTYHKTSNLLHCHYCGYSDSPMEVCPACGVASIESKGFGTERIEEELELLLPDARIGRLDIDSTRGKYGFEKIITAFDNHEIDILIGTQMIAKGLDFGKVSLIGIINADTIINFPDFRAYERAYALFTQVSGRAGRRDVQGRVIIQTYSPDHRVLQQVLRQDYDDMFMTEITERKNFRYPPFYRLIRIELKHEDMYICQDAAQKLADILRASFAERVLGPEPPLVSRVRKNYIQAITLKIERQEVSIVKVKEILKNAVGGFQIEKHNRSVRIQIDVDPF